MMRIKVSNSSLNIGKTRLELDSHADTTVLGKGYLVVHYFDKPVNVNGYDPKDGSKVWRTVTGFLVYDHPQTGKPYLLGNQPIYVFGSFGASFDVSNVVQDEWGKYE